MRGTSTNQEAEEHGADGAALEIGVGERREALQLVEALSPFHSFLVQDAHEQRPARGGRGERS